MLRTALCLRTYLLRRGNSAERFAESLHGVMDIAPEVFEEYADELRQGTGRMVAVLDIDLDRSEFASLDSVDGWEIYAIPDMSIAAWYANRKDELDWEQRLDIFGEYLETRIIRCDGPQVEPPTGPAM